jgi:hypothetical protein
LIRDRDSKRKAVPERVKMTIRPMEAHWFSPNRKQAHIQTMPSVI